MVMNRPPKISVVIASYNHEPYVAESVESVLNQSFGDLELIITDDGSTDQTVGVVNEFRDSRLSIEVFKKNRGACVALNHCIRRAQGEFIAILNSDDTFMPDKLAKQFNFMVEHPEIGAVFALPEVVDQRGNPIADGEFLLDQQLASRWDWLRYFFDQRNILCHPSVLIRRKCYEKVGLYDARLAQLPDFDMWIRLCQQFEIHVLQEKLIKLRKLDDMKNASSPRIEVLLRATWEGRQILNHYRKMSPMELINVFPEFTNNSANVMRELAWRALKRGNQVHAAFGLDLLHDIMPPENQEEDYAKFIAMTGLIDVFGIGWVHRLTAELDTIKKIQRVSYTRFV